MRGFNSHVQLSDPEAQIVQWSWPCRQSVVEWGSAQVFWPQEPRKTLCGIAPNLPRSEQRWGNPIPYSSWVPLGSLERGNQEAKWRMGLGLTIRCVPLHRPGTALACRLRGYWEGGSHFPDLIWLPFCGSLPQFIKYESWLLVSWDLTVVKLQQTGGNFQLNLWKLLNSDLAYDNLSAVFFCISWNIVSIKQLFCLRHCNIILYLWETQFNFYCFLQF